MLKDLLVAHARLRPPMVWGYSISPRDGNPIASILKSNAEGIPALFVLNPVFNFLGFPILGGPL